MKLVKNQVKKKLITKQKNPHHIEWQNSMASGRIFIKKKYSYNSKNIQSTEGFSQCNMARKKKLKASILQSKK